MPYYPKKDYKLVRFERSHLPAKKYDAILLNKATGRYVTVPFGARAYEQYRDRVPLGLYTAKNHGDKARRANYRSRHSRDINKAYSPSWFSLKYLW
jgi:hypothetical protein